MRHSSINLSYLPLFPDNRFDLRLIEGWNRPTKQARVVSIEDAEVRIVPYHLVSIVEVIRSIMLNRCVGVQRGLMPVPVRAWHRHSRNPVALLGPHSKPLGLLLIDCLGFVVLHKYLELRRVPRLLSNHLIDGLIVLSFGRPRIHFYFQNQ